MAMRQKRSDNASAVRLKELPSIGPMCLRDAASPAYWRKRVEQNLVCLAAVQVLSVRWAYDDPNPVAVVGRKRAALDAVESAALSAWDALPADEKRARIAMAQQARALRVSAVAAAMPAALLAAGGGEGSTPADSSLGAWGPGSDWEHEGGLDQQHAAYAGAGDDAAVQQQQQSWPDAYHTAQQQQQHSVAAAVSHSAQEAAQPSSWFQGWQQRHKPETFADTLAARAGGSAAQRQHTQQGGGASEGDAAAGLGLLAGYGSDTESEQEAGAEAADLQGQQQHQQDAGALHDSAQPLAEHQQLSDGAPGQQYQKQEQQHQQQVQESQQACT